MNAMELLDIIGTARDPYVAEAGKIRGGEARPQRRGLSINRTALIAAVIALLLLLVGCVAYMLSLNDLVLGQETHRDSTTGETEIWNMLSLQGFAGSDNYLAAREWYEFRETHTAPYSDFDVPEGYEAYGCYSQEMKDKIDEICRKYALKLLGGAPSVNTVDSIFRAVQIDGITDESEAAEVSLEGGYFYQGGTFQIDGETGLIGENSPWAYPVSYQFRCVMKDTFDNVFLNIGDINGFEQWIYTMEDGTELLLAISEEKALIIADKVDFFITVNILNPRVGDILTGERTMDRAALEAVAETFDFSFTPREASEEDIAAVEESMAEYGKQLADAYKKKIHLYKELGYDARVKFQMENSATPDQLGFAMMDLDGNGVEELLVGENGYIRAIYTAKDGGTQHLLSLGAGYADEFITYNWIGVGAATAPTYIYLCENNSLVYVYDSTNAFIAYHFAQLEGDQLVWKEFLQYNPDYDADSPWRWGTEFTQTEPITEEEFNSILNSYVRVPVVMVPISEYSLTDDSPSGIGESDSVYNSYDEFIVARTSGDRDHSNWDYTLIDLDMDGQDELFWVEGAWKGIFTMENGQVKLVVNGEDLTLCEGNIIALTHHYLDGNMACCYYKVENGNAVLVDYLRCDAGKSPSSPWFRSSDASGQDISLQAISREEAERINSSYVPVELEMKPITEYPLE